MPWLSLALALLTYLLSPKDTATQRRNALLGAAVVGGATYATTHYTDWGKENLGQFDGVVDTSTVPVADPTSSTLVPATTGASATSNGLWDKIKSWGPLAASAVVGGAVATGSNRILIIGAVALGAYLLLK